MGPFEDKPLVGDVYELIILVRDAHYNYSRPAISYAIAEVVVAEGMKSQFITFVRICSNKKLCTACSFHSCV